MKDDSFTVSLSDILFPLIWEEEEVFSWGEGPAFSWKEELVLHAFHGGAWGPHEEACGEPDGSFDSSGAPLLFSCGGDGGGRHSKMSLKQ